MNAMRGCGWLHGMRAKMRGRALSTGKARVKALRPTAGAGVDRPPPSSSTVRDPAMGMAPSRVGVSYAAFRWRRCVGASIQSRIRGAGCRARRPRRRDMIRGDSSDVCGSAQSPSRSIHCEAKGYRRRRAAIRDCLRRVQLLHKRARRCLHCDKLGLRDSMVRGI